MALGQGLMNHIGGLVETVIGGQDEGGLYEKVSYSAKATPAAPPVVADSISALITQYTQQAILADPVLQKRRRCLIRVIFLENPPTLYDTLTREDGSAWKVEAISAGPGTPWWILQLQQVG